LLLIISLVVFTVHLCFANNNVKISDDSYRGTIAKIESQIDDFILSGLELSRRVLVIYHIGDISLASNSPDIATNNLKIFVNAVESHSKSAKFQAFYLFNVVDSHSPLADLIPVHKENVGVWRWNTANSDMDTHFRTLHMLSSNITDRFAVTIFANQGLRGPIVKRTNGDWIEEFAKQFLRDNIGMVSPTMSCEVSPHCQTHMFALKNSIMPVVLHGMKETMKTKFVKWTDVVASMEVGLTGIVMRAGYNVTSFLYMNKGHPYFRPGHCLEYKGPTSRFAMNPTSWCGIHPKDLMFVKWGGEPMRTPGLICNDSLADMENLLHEMATEQPSLGLISPEVLIGGIMYPLYKEYIAESWLSKNIVARSNAVSVLNSNKVASSDKACFLVRVPQLFVDKMVHENQLRALNDELDTIVSCKDFLFLADKFCLFCLLLLFLFFFFAALLRQKNGNWKALFFRIDSTSPTNEELDAALKRYNDLRLKTFILHDTPNLAVSCVHSFFFYCKFRHKIELICVVFLCSITMLTQDTAPPMKFLIMFSFMKTSASGSR
jgi:hypothetical protein